MAIDIGLTLGAVSAVAIPVGFGIGVVAMASPSRGEFWFARICFIVAAVAAIISFAWLTHEMALNVQKVISAGAFGAVVSISLIWAIDWVNKKEALPTVAEPAPPTPLLIECHIAPLPTTIPPEGIVNLFSPFRMGADAKSIGFGQRTGQPGEKWEWPKPWASMSLNSYRCAVTNYGTEPIFSVNLPVTVRYKETVRDPKTPGSAKTGNITSSDDSNFFIAKIDPKSSFVFYTYNQDSDFFEVLLAQRPTTYLKAGATENEQASILQASQTYFGLWPLPKEEPEQKTAPKSLP